MIVGVNRLKYALISNKARACLDTSPGVHYMTAVRRPYYYSVAKTAWGEDYLLLFIGANNMDDIRSLLMERFAVIYAQDPERKLIVMTTKTGSFEKHFKRNPNEKKPKLVPVDDMIRSVLGHEA